MKEMEQEIIRDQDGEYLTDLMHKNNITSPLEWSIGWRHAERMSSSTFEDGEMLCTKILRYDGHVIA